MDNRGDNCLQAETRRRNRKQVPAISADNSGSEQLYILTVDFVRIESD